MYTATPSSIDLAASPAREGPPFFVCFTPEAPWYATRNHGRQHRGLSRKGLGTLANKSGTYQQLSPMGTLTVEIDGETREVSDDQVQSTDGVRLLGENEVPDGTVTQETMNAKIRDRLADERRRIVNGEGEKGEELQKKTLRNAGVPLDENGNPDLPDDPDFDPDAERERIKSQVKENEVEPLKDELANYKQRTQQLLESRKKSELLSAAQKHGVRKEFLQPPTDGADPPVVQVFGNAVGYDEDRDTFAMKGKDGFVPASKEGQTWAGVDELFEQKKSQDAYQHMFEDNRPGESGVGETSSSGKGTPTVTNEDLESGAVDPDAILNDEVQVAS